MEVDQSGGGVPSVVADEDRAYNAWKGWGTQMEFGSLSKANAACYKTEMRGLDAVSDVLEIGFGNGAFLAFCKTRNWSVVGIELNDLLVKAGRAADFDVRSTDALAGLAAESFDLIVAFDVLEHIAEDEMVDFLNVLGRKLRPRGTMLFRFPNADSWLGNNAQYGDPTHRTAIGYFKMQYFAAKAESLELIEFRPQARVGFSSGFKKGIHSLVTTPIIIAIGWFNKMLHYPGVPLVLSSQNVVAIVRHRHATDG